MTPQQHLEVAESLITPGPTTDQPYNAPVDIAVAITALAHACIAIGDLLGAPHATGPAGGPSSGG